jgi:hypothetical protein
VLGVVLVAMMIGLSLITALLGLSFTTQRAAITQQELARERRAADGALEVAVEEIRSNYSPGDPLCDPVLALGTVAMDLGGEASDEVTLKCGDILDPTPNAAGDVKVVGEYAPSLQHNGSSTLSVVGAITVKKGAAFLGSAAPALEVAGNYVQGDPCDLAFPVKDAKDDPECDSSAAQSLSAGLSGLTPALPPTLTPIPATCPSDDTGRSFGTGRFGAAQVSQLNWLFENCGGTFRFQPGSYWFDGTLDFKNPANPDLPRTVVLIGDADENTMTCTSGGTTVVLAATATIKHESGRVLLCGDLVQTSEVDEGPTLVNPTSTRFTDVANVLPGAPSPAFAEMEDVWNTVEATVVANGTRPIESLVLRWSSQETPQRPNMENRGVRAEFIGPGGQSCSTPLSWRGRTHYQGAVVGSQVNLMSGDCATLLGPKTESDLNGWKLRVHYSQTDCIAASTCKFYLTNLQLRNQTRSILTTGTPTSGGAAPWNAADGITAAGGAAAYVDNSCNYPVPWPLDGSNYCSRSPTDPASSLSVSGFELPAGLEANDRLTSTVLAVDGVVPTHAEDLLADPSNSGGSAVQGTTTAKIDYDDVDGQPTSCSASMSSYLRSRQTYYLDLSECPGLSTAGQLVDASVELSIQPEKGTWITTLDPNDNDWWVGDAGLELPTLDFVRLIATTNTVNDTVDIAVNIDEANGSSFRVYGVTKLPRANLAVTWAGTATAEALFNGDLIVRSVNSTQALTSKEVGVLCCGPMSPTIRVNAYTDAPPGGGQPAVIRGTARIRLDLAAGGDTTVTVADWQLCHLDGCKLNDTVLPP